MTLYIQFDKSVKFNQLIYLLADHLKISIEDFYNDYFDIDTCKSDGLDNWGRLLDENRVIYKPDLDNCFGFDNGPPHIDGKYPENFDNSNFWGGQITPIILDDDTYRLLLKFKYKNTITNASLASANAIMNSFFKGIDPTYKVRVTDNGTMKIKFEFNFYLTDDQYAIFITRNILPVPIGVDFTIEQGVII